MLAKKYTLWGIRRKILPQTLLEGIHDKTTNKRLSVLSFAFKISINDIDNGYMVITAQRFDSADHQQNKIMEE